MHADERKGEPGPDCPLCPRLVAFRQGNRQTHPDWWNAPAPSFGTERAKLLVLGLAPGIRGANRTGRPFTGDAAGDVLYPALKQAGLAEGTYAAHPDDGFQLKGVMVSNAVRCVPPQNKPNASEIRTCNRFLHARLATLPELGAVLALGRIAHDSLLMACGFVRARYPFGHGITHRLSLPDGRPLTLIDCYHCSRYNLNTRRLTEAMLSDTIALAAKAAGLA